MVPIEKTSNKLSNWQAFVRDQIPIYGHLSDVADKWNSMDPNDKAVYRLSNYHTFLHDHKGHGLDMISMWRNLSKQEQLNYKQNRTPLGLDHYHYPPGFVDHFKTIWISEGKHPNLLPSDVVACELDKFNGY